jgi:hypothetical protein
MQIDNARVVLLENIRQSCIFKTYDMQTDIYWNYMMNFSELCADINNLLFTEECSYKVMKLVNVVSTDIETCMEKLIKGI